MSITSDPRNDPPPKVVVTTTDSLGKDHPHLHHGGRGGESAPNGEGCCVRVGSSTGGVVDRSAIGRAQRLSSNSESKTNDDAAANASTEDEDAQRFLHILRLLSQKRRQRQRSILRELASSPTFVEPPSHGRGVGGTYDYSNTGPTLGNIMELSNGVDDDDDLDDSSSVTADLTLMDSSSSTTATESDRPAMLVPKCK